MVLGPSLWRSPSFISRHAESTLADGGHKFQARSNIINMFLDVFWYMITKWKMSEFEFTSLNLS